jgi:L-aminoadipate-semialdehyde dehydrogenase
VTNTDDFLVRLMKGCIELGQVPRIASLINACPVDYVAGVVAELGGGGVPAAPRGRVYHITNPVAFRYDDLFHALTAAYPLRTVEYEEWCTALVQLTLEVREEHALFPLLHHVLEDLPTRSASPALDDANTQALVRGMSALVCAPMASVLPLYLGYLERVGFLPACRGVGEVGGKGSPPGHSPFHRSPKAKAAWTGRRRQ